MSEKARVVVILTKAGGLLALRAAEVVAELERRRVEQKPKARP